MTKLKYLTIFAIFAFLSTANVAVSQTSKVLKISEVIDLAIGNSQKMNASRFDLEAARSEVSQSYTSFLPSVRGIGQARATSTSNPFVSSRPIISVGVEVNQLIFDFGKAERQVAISKERVTENLYILRQSLQDVILEAIQNYVNAWHSQRKFNHYLANETTVQEIREAIDARVKSGLSPARELTQIELRLRRANTSRLEAEYEAISRRERLSIQIGKTLDENTLFEVDSNFDWFADIPLNLEDAKQQASMNNLQLSVARSQSRQAALAASAAFRNYFPSISALYRYETGREGDQNFVSNTGQINFNVAFYEGGRTSAAYQQSVSRSRAIAASLAEAERRGESGIRVQWSLLQGLDASKNRWAEALQQQENLLNQIEAETNQGLQSVTVFLDAKSDITDLIISSERFAADLLLAKAGIMHLTGNISPEVFGIETPAYIEIIK